MRCGGLIMNYDNVVAGFKCVMDGDSATDKELVDTIKFLEDSIAVLSKLDKRYYLVLADFHSKLSILEGFIRSRKVG
jgi:hypothetical protein